ncbi:unnamed protein product [Dracunculus medinensis]|uniref:Ovule protein n=1 Tax=Dracunculus medinensis TaxID=318479 RepID=A0A0N4UQP2_DRAME|nr:unnamed protein product [Dracunculus medinensis]
MHSLHSRFALEEIQKSYQHYPFLAFMWNKAESCIPNLVFQSSWLAFPFLLHHVYFNRIDEYAKDCAPLMV